MAASVSHKWTWIVVLTIGVPAVGWLFVRDCHSQLRSEATEYMWKDVRMRDYRGVKELVSHGTADVNDRHVGGITPLIFAVQNDDPEMVRTLVSLHAALDIRTTSGKTARDVAVEMNRSRLLPLLSPKNSQR